MAGYESIGSLGTASNPFSVTTIGGSSPNNIAVEGNVANGAADSGNPVKIGGVVAPLTGGITALAAGQRTNAQFDKYGSQRVQMTVIQTGGNDGVANSSAGYFGADYAADPSARSLALVAGMVFNGTAWDRQRGDVNGSDVVSAARPTAGGVTQFRRIATADTNAVAVKASAGRVYGYVISNTSAAVKFVKLYNKATAPTVGTDVPVRTIMVPANGIAAYHIGPGLGGFAAGIALAATGAAADTDTTALAAGDLIIQIDYA